MADEIRLGMLMLVCPLVIYTQLKGNSGSLGPWCLMLDRQQNPHQMNRRGLLRPDPEQRLRGSPVSSVVATMIYQIVPTSLPSVSRGDGIW